MDLSVLVAPTISAIVAAVGAFAGAWLAFSTRLTRVETKVDGLAESVNKHNKVIERTYKVETDVSNIYHRIDDIKDEINHYHH